MFFGFSPFDLPLPGSLASTFELFSSLEPEPLVTPVTTIHDVLNRVFLLGKVVPNSMMTNITALSQLMDKLEIIAPSYDRPGRPVANGFRCIIKVVNKFVPKLVQFSSLGDPRKLQRSITYSGRIQFPLQQVNSINAVLTILIELCNLALYCHKNWSQVEGPKEKFLWLQRTYCYTYDKLKSQLQQYWAHHQIFWLDPSLRYYLSMSTTGFAVLQQPPLSLLSLVCKKDRGSRLTSITWKSDPFYQTGVINLLDNPVIENIGKLIMRFHDIKVDTINIPRQTDWIIPFDGSPVSRADLYTGPISYETTDAIRLRLYRVISLPPSGTVIIHIQGGGFMVDAHVTHANYLRQLLPDLAGAILINIDYSVSVRYPIALQEIVDTLLWLTRSGTMNQVASFLQFIPSQVVLLGDSCGGYLGLAATAILRDIADQAAEEITLMPSSMVCLSPVMAPVNLNFTPSLLLSILDPFLSPTLNLQILSLYCSGITLDSECQAILDHPTDSNLSSSSSSSPDDISYTKESTWHTLTRCLFNKDPCWFDCDPITFEKRLAKLTDQVFHPYISLLTSYDLTRLSSNLKVHLITSDLDVQLDSVFEFERIWKGFLTIDVIDDLPHGFYTFTMLSDLTQAGVHMCLKRLKQAIGLEPSHGQ